MGFKELVGRTSKVGAEDIQFGTGLDGDVFDTVSPSGGVMQKQRIPSLSLTQTSVMKGVYYLSMDPGITDHSATSGADWEAYNLARVINQIGAQKVKLYAGSGVINLGGNTVTLPLNIEFGYEHGTQIVNGTLVVEGPTLPIVVKTLDEMRTQSPKFYGQTILAIARSVVGDRAGGGLRYGVTGYATGTYTDDGRDIVVPVGGDGSSAWVTAVPFIENERLNEIQQLIEDAGMVDIAALIETDLNVNWRYHSAPIFCVSDDDGNIGFEVKKDGAITTSRVNLSGNIELNENGDIETDTFYIKEIPNLKFSIADEAGNVILGIDRAGRLVANFDLVPSTTDPEQQIQTESNYDHDVNQVFIYGQSLSVGQATPVISTTQNYDNLMFVGGMRPQYDYPENTSGANYGSFVPAVEAQSPTQPLLAETPSMGMGDMIKERMSAADVTANYQILMSSPGYGSTTIAQLSKGTVHYGRLIEQAEYGRTGANSGGKTHCVRAVTWAQGESDYLAGTTRENYLSRLNQLVTDLNADVQLAIGQSESIPLISYQLATHKTGGSTTPTIALAILDGAENNSLIHIATPMYHFTYKDGFHLTNISSRWLGAYYGLAYKRIVIEGTDWTPLTPIAITVQSNIMVIKFNVPSGELFFDTTIVALNTHYGFELVDGSGVPIDISSVVINSPTTVKIVASTVIPSGAKVRYAWSGSGNYGPVNGPRGNLRDTQGDQIVFDPMGINKPMHNWCVIFEKEVV